jgi:hypothetical protein
MKVSIQIKVVDILVIGFALALTIVSAFAVYDSGNARESFFIEAPDRNWTYPINAETRVELEGAIGVSVAEIRGGTIRMISSPCANQTCVAAGSINKTGQWIACLPNQVFMYVEGKEETDDSIDGATW